MIPMTPSADPARSPRSAVRILAANPLAAFFAPHAVAVIGATETHGSVGRALLENLASFEGRVFPVNPKRRTVLGRPAFPSLAALPETADLAVIVTPAATVPGLIRECAEAGIRNAIIISAGFKETGPAGQALEEAVLAEARLGGVRIIGPNCLGVMTPRLGFNATFATSLALPGKVAFLSQSGALCTAILDWSLREQVGFSAFVSVGSMLDVNWGDLIEHLGDDPNTTSIVCYMESVGDARRFLSAAREVAYTKPVIIIKVGRSAAAARAAASHTGALTGSDDVLDAAFRRAGVLRVDTIGELFNMAELLAKQPRPGGPRLAIVTNAGGPGALATDLLVTSGGELAALEAATISSLDTVLPNAWSHGNPVDILGDAGADRFAAAVDAVSRDPATDGTLVILTPQKMTEPEVTAKALATMSASGKPLLTSWMGGASLDTSRDILNAAGIPTYEYPDTAARAFALMWRYADNLRAIYETPALPLETGDVRSMAESREFIEGIRRGGRMLLTELESKQLLAAYGIPTVPTKLAEDVESAVRLADEVGYPVVLKLHSQTITHKTDVGGVQLDLTDEAAVRAAWRRIEITLLKRAGEGHFHGCTVQPMIERTGYELILGSSIDPQFGPVLLFGAGGQLVEILQDRALGLPPLNTVLARQLMERTRIFRALGGVRGAKPVDLEALAGLLVAFSRLVIEQPWIAEIDINPLLVSDRQVIALDARVVLHPPDTDARALPRPAIRPYPVHLVSTATLRDGVHVTVRPIRAEDEPAAVDFHRRLSEQSVYSRFFTTVPLAERVSHHRLARICFADYDREISLIVLAEDGPTVILAALRLTRRHATREADFGLLVIDAWQGRGLGKLLVSELLRVARGEGLERVHGMVLAENQRMLEICRKKGFVIIPRGAECEVILEVAGEDGLPHSQ
jgi:acetyltransferase